MRFLGIGLSVLFVLCIPVFLLTTNVRLAVNSTGLYEYGFEKYSVSEVTGIEIEELGRAAGELIGYFNSAEEPIDITVSLGGEEVELFNEREVEHLAEVKDLIGLCYLVQEATLGYIIAFAGIGYLWKWRGFLPRLTGDIFWGGALTIVLLIALGIGALVGFEQLFLWFHYLFFSSDTWILDPYTDRLIMMFPEGFFYDATLFIAGATAAEAVVLGGAGFFLLRRRKPSR